MQRLQRRSCARGASGPTISSRFGAAARRRRARNLSVLRADRVELGQREVAQADQQAAAGLT
jgi:hypothetical protein